MPGCHNEPRTAPAALIIGGLLSAGACGNATAAACEPWPAWEGFSNTYVSDEGRVIDYSTPQRVTTSEGQAYVLAFSLIANDESAFARILRWTQDNLAGGSLGAALPAWQWGRRDDGSWGVLDSNPASDADLWIAYALSEAGRLWQDARYAALGQAVAGRILREEVARLPGLGPTVLPAPHGFVHAGQWRLNPSYVPLEVLRGLQHHGGEAVWGDLVRSSHRLIVESAPRGFAPDWSGYRPAEGFQPDPATGPVGSYGAIRVYLWAGMLSGADEFSASLLLALRPMAALVARSGVPPESVDTLTGTTRGTGSPGFSAALLPLLVASRMPEAAERQRLRASPPEAGRDNQSYYSDVLGLFGLGWRENRYRFGRDGLLSVPWNQSCRRAH